MKENPNTNSPWVCPKCETELKLSKEYEDRLEKLGKLWDACRSYRESERLGNLPSLDDVMFALEQLDKKVQQ